MQVIIGSYALNYAEFPFRKAKDFDIWITNDENKPDVNNVDVHIAPIEIIKLIPVIPDTNIATPNAIYTIKCSHLGWDIFWEKHKSDIIWMKANGKKNRIRRRQKRRERTKNRSFLILKGILK